MNLADRFHGWFLTFLMLVQLIHITGFSIAPVSIHKRNLNSPVLSKRPALLPQSLDAVEPLLTTLSGPPTGEQYATYWGKTPRERYGKLFESVTVSFIGMFFSYFLSFIVGGFAGTILGAIFCFWTVLSPELQAYQRNQNFLNGQSVIDWNEQEQVFEDLQGGLYSALFTGHIAGVAVVESAWDETEYDLKDFEDYKMATDELELETGRPYLLRVRCADSAGRELQVHSRMSEEYLDEDGQSLVDIGMPVVGLLLSAKPDFSELAAISDLYVPDTYTWIGDYPYLDRGEMEHILEYNDHVWKKLQQERLPQKRRTMSAPSEDLQVGELVAPQQ